MIQVEELYHYFCEKEITYFTGVPDSQLKPFCDFITSKLGIGKQHIIAANEGNAVALATGYYLATGKVGMVYLQNSGLGNAVNPITSLTDPEVYKIPVVYMVGWRGQPGRKDEPQHIKQGKITLELLDLLSIKYMIVTKDTTIEVFKRNFDELLDNNIKNGESIALVMEKNSLESTSDITYNNSYTMTREEAIRIITNNLNEEDLIVSTTGKTSRELFECREIRGEGHEKDFLTVGSMGHASMIAMGIAENSNKRVWCIDGDGAMIMHTGASALIGNRKPKNLYHILLNNEAHESVGGMPTISYSIKWGEVVKAFGYLETYRAADQEALKNIILKVKKQEGPVFIEVMVNTSSRNDLMRPTVKPVDNKLNIMNFIKK